VRLCASSRRPSDYLKSAASARGPVVRTRLVCSPGTRRRASPTPEQPLEARSEVLSLPEVQERREDMEEAAGDFVFAEDRIERSMGVGRFGEPREYQCWGLYQHGKAHRRRVKMQVEFELHHIEQRTAMGVQFAGEQGQQLIKVPVPDFQARGAQRPPQGVGDIHLPDPPPVQQSALECAGGVAPVGTLIGKLGKRDSAAKRTSASNSCRRRSRNASVKSRENLTKMSVCRPGSACAYSIDRRSFRPELPPKNGSQRVIAPEQAGRRSGRQRSRSSPGMLRADTP
jgi:hypothetical protein